MQVILSLHEDNKNHGLDKDIQRMIRFAAAEVIAGL